MENKIVTGIIGSGTMGRGIAQISATNNHKTVIFDINKNALKAASEFLNKMINKLVKKGKIQEGYEEIILNNLIFTDDFNDLSDCDIVIEAVSEDLNLKQKIFADLEKITDDQTVFGTNTSSLSIASISSALDNPERLIGIHFFNPAPLLPLVEIVPSLLTENSLAERIKKLMSDWGKTPVITKDTPGFIVNRVARPYYGEALRIYEEGTADFVTIDWAMRELGGFKMGPFELMDLIGNDVNYKVNEKVFEQMYFDPRYKPSLTQKRFLDAGLLGRKTGKGFYDYSDNALQPLPDKDRMLGEQIFFRIIYMLINEATDALRLNIATKDDIDLAMQKGVNYPKGLLKWADEIGIDQILAGLELMFDEYGEDRYRPSPLLRRMAVKEKTFY